MIDASVIAAVVAGLAAVVGAWFSYRASTRATAVEGSKVDAAAYERARAIYESALQTLEDQLVKLRERMTELNQQLAQEQDTSNAMRAQIRELRSQVDLLEDTVTDLRLQLSKSGIQQEPPEEEGAQAS
ncbi:hypothetical protein [Micrococcus luteus]|uniref:hypothetical protein n=1 Tax=Micrococcus luteus TaxID=1270 RepID=UPI00332FFF85